MMAHHGRKAHILSLVLSIALGAAVMVPAGALAQVKSLSLGHAKHVAVHKMKHMERQLKGQGAQDSSVRGCWHEDSGIGCLGLVSGKDDFVRWQCAVPMTIRKRATASSAARRVAVKFTDPMCSF
jgi:hypothetical protein